MNINLGYQYSDSRLSYATSKQTIQINYPSHLFFKQTLRLQLNQKEEQDSDLRLGLRQNTQEIKHSQCHSKQISRNRSKIQQNQT